MYTIRYCQRALLRISFCLLLVCSANVASAQTASLSGAETDGLTISFTINLPSILSGTAFSELHIDGVGSKDIRRDSAMGASGCNASIRSIQDDPLIYLICTSNTRSVRVELTLNEPNRPTTMTVTLDSISSNYMSSVDMNNNTLNFTVNPLIRLRVKVFLEGPLAMTYPLHRRGMIRSYGLREFGGYARHHPVRLRLPLLHRRGIA